MDPANIAALGAVLNAVQARLDAGRPADTDPFPDPHDFRPAFTRSEEQLLNFTRHKHQSQYQHVDPVEAATHPTVGTEPRRQSTLTIAAANKSIPTSAISWCNEKSITAYHHRASHS